MRDRTLHKEFRRLRRELITLNKTFSGMGPRHQPKQARREPSIVGIIDLTLNKIWKETGLFFEAEHILGPRRGAPLAEARHRCIRAVAAALPGISGAEIAKAFNRDHTTIGYALKKSDSDVLERKGATR